MNFIKNKKGFSFIELVISMIIMVAFVSVIAVNITQYVEQSKETADYNTLKQCYRQISTEIVDKGSSGGVTFDVTQTKDGWQNFTEIELGRYTWHIGDADTDNWVGTPVKGGSCTLTFVEEIGVVVTWNAP